MKQIFLALFLLSSCNFLSAMKQTDLMVLWQKNKYPDSRNKIYDDLEFEYAVTTLILQNPLNTITLDWQKLPNPPMLPICKFNEAELKEMINTSKHNPFNK